MVRSWRRPRTSWPVSWGPSWRREESKERQVGSHVTNVTAAWPCSEARPASRLPVRTYGRVGLRSLLWRRIIFQAFGFLSLVSRVTPPRVSASASTHAASDPLFGGHIQKNETSLVTAGATFAAQAHDRMQCATMRHGRLQARFAGWQKRCKLPPENTFRSVVADGQLPFCALHTGLCIDQPCEYCTVWHPLACISTWRASAETASG